MGCMGDAVKSRSRLEGLGFSYCTLSATGHEQLQYQARRDLGAN